MRGGGKVHGQRARPRVRRDRRVDLDRVVLCKEVLDVLFKLRPKEWAVVDDAVAAVPHDAVDLEARQRAVKVGEDEEALRPRRDEPLQLALERVGVPDDDGIVDVLENPMRQLAIA